MKLIFAILIALPTFSYAIDLTTEQMIEYCHYRMAKINVKKEEFKNDTSGYLYFLEGEYQAFEDMRNLLWTNTD